MAKVDIFSGFLGAGKTTLIKKLIAEAYKGEKVVLIENEFGQIGIDGGFLKDAGIEITEMNSGCICCSLVGDFGEALKKVVAQFNPDRILIEPSGVGKLSDVIKAVQGVDSDELVLNGFTTVVDAKKCKIYEKNFGEFFDNQIEYASSIILSHTKGLAKEKIDEDFELLRKHNPTASIITTEWDDLTGKQILATMEQKNTLETELEKLKEEAKEELKHPHHHHHHEHEHDHDNHEEHEHHHHHHDGDDHDADEIFTSWGRETTHRYTKDDINKILTALEDSSKYGTVLRAKGIVESTDNSWIHFDYIPGTPDVRSGSSATTGMICVIGSELNEKAIEELFN